MDMHRFSVAGQPRLANLPLDILVQIQSFMDSTDIISFRQTCKLIASATRQRTVWLEALRRVSVVNGVFWSTFPLEEMSNRALEHAATSPSRFTKLVMKSETTPHPFATRLLNTHPRGSLDLELEDYRLVPGGRFLFTRSGDSIIHLWDLGYTSEAMIKPFPIASMEGARLQLLDLHPTGDDMGIRMLLSSACTENTESIIVYEVYPLSAAPSFQVIASFEGLDRAAEVYSSTQDVIAFYHGYFVTVWNFVLDSIVTWDVSMEYQSIKLFKDHVILFDDAWFTLWNIPPLQPRVGGGISIEPVTSQQTPVWTFSYPYRDDFSRVSIPHSPWFPDGRPIYFSHSAVTTTNQISYYMLKSTGNQQDDGIPSSIPVLMAWGITHGFEGGELYGDMRFCNDWLVQPWVEDDQVVINVAKIPATRREDAPMKTLLLWASNRSDDVLQCFDFCPVSGRLCCTVADNGFEVRVMDFIVPL